MALLIFLLIVQESYSVVYSKSISAKCKFEYNNYTNINLCFKGNIERLDECITLPSSSNLGINKYPLASTVNFDNLNLTVSKSKVRPLPMPNERYDNVAEPSFASNGTYVFYTANHFAAKSPIGYTTKGDKGSNWNHIDPSFDFKGVLQQGNTTSNNATSGNATQVNIFEADQRALYDPYHSMYI